MNHRLNQYLDDLESRLRFMGEAERQQEINEIRAHLQDLIAAYQKRGQTEDQATQSALRQFGTVRALSRRLRQMEQRKRLVQTSETVVFSAAFHVVYTILEQGVLHTWQSIAPLPSELANESFRLSPLLWAVGFAAFVVLFWRFGWRGTAQKALHKGSPTSAALCFLFGVNFVLIGWNFFESFLSRAFPTTALRVSDIAATIGFIFGLCWLVSFWVGRRSRYRGSVADSVGTAAALIPIWGLFGVTIEYVPSVAAFVKDWPGYLTGAACWIIPGTLFVLLVRLGVQWGEKARQLSPQTTQIA